MITNIVNLEQNSFSEILTEFIHRFDISILLILKGAHTFSMAQDFKMLEGD